MQHDEEHQEHQERQVVHVIPKGETHEIRVSLSKYKGRTFGDLRLFIRNKQGEWIPTQKGCTIDVKRLHELEEAVWKLRDASDPTRHPSL
jgi:hypothetical protein